MSIRPLFSRARDAITDYKDEHGTEEAKTILRRHFGPRARVSDMDHAALAKVDKFVEEVESELTKKKPAKVTPTIAETISAARFGTISGFSSQSEPDCTPKTLNDHLQQLISGMATVTKLASKTTRWGLESVDPRQHVTSQHSNRALLLAALDVLRSRIEATERQITKDLFEFDLTLATRLQAAIAELTSAKGAQTTLAVMREIGNTDDPRRLLADPVRAQSVIDRCKALVDSTSVADLDDGDLD